MFAWGRLLLLWAVQTKQWRAVLRDLLPPVVSRFLSGLLSGRTSFVGDFGSWEEAASHAGAYDSASILEKVTTAAALVRDGKAAFERDSVTFESREYPWPVLVGLLRASVLRPDRSLSVLDFGGSLGSSYYLCRPYLEAVLPSLRWSIVEQQHFVARGRAGFETPQLRFYESIAACLQSERPNVVLLSSVLAYLPRPFEILEELLGFEPNTVILDRTAVLQGQQRLTVQHVSRSFYPASYPAWFLDEARIVKAFAPRYELVASFDAVGGDVRLSGGATAQMRGFIFSRRTT